MKIFEKITYKSLSFVVEQLSTFEYSRKDVIKNIYKDNFTNFEDNLEFLRILGLIQVADETINIVPSVDNKNLKTEIIKALIKNQAISEYFQSYIKNYTSDNSNNYSYKERDTSYSDLRNFLMSIGLIEYLSDKEYKVNEVYADYIFKAHNNYSPEELERDNTLKKEIGDAAEAVIMDFEKERIKSTLSDNFFVNQISKKDVTAGYDIHSGVNSKLHQTQRFIEVKAVSLDNLSFYWSIGEILESERRGDSYYLYLLPITRSNKPYEFAVDKIFIIKNPYINVYNNKSWKQEVIKYKFNLIDASPPGLEPGTKP